MAPSGSQPVDVITGPGNAWVAEAKRQLYGVVGIDMVAGPSEILVIADGRNDPEWIAADLLSQAEHDPVAQSILITDDPLFADTVADRIGVELAMLPTARVAAESWNTHGVIIEVASLDEAPALANALAAEHVQIAVDDPEPLFAGDPPRRLGLPRPDDARGGRRLRRRAEPRAAHRAARAFLLGPVGARFHEAHQLHPARRGGAQSDRPRRDRAGRCRGPARACPLHRSEARHMKRQIERPAPPPASPRCRRSTSTRWRRPRSPGCSTNSTSTASAWRSTTTQYAEAEVAFFDDLVKGTLARRDEIDALLAGKLAEGWKIERLDKTMLQILRAGAYELLARADVPTGTAISEYVDVAHAFFDAREAKFVNGVLDAVAKDGALTSELAFIAALRATGDASRRARAG